MEEKKEDSSNLLQTLLRGLDYGNNLGRTAAYAAIAPGVNVWDSVLKAASGNLETPAWMIRQALDSRGVPGMQDIGLNDGRFQWGDVADVGRDVLIDVATDPLSYLTFGVGKAAGLAAKGLDAAAAASKTANLANAAAKGSQVINTLNRANLVAPALAGGLIGAGTINTGDSIPEGLAKVLGGATVGGLAKFTGSRIADSIVDSAPVKSILSLSQPAMETAGKIAEKAGPAAAGAILSSGTIDSDDSTLDAFGKLGAGAAAGLGAKALKPIATTAIGDFAKDATNYIAGQTKLHSLTNPDLSIRKGNEVMQKLEQHRNWIADGNLQALSKLSPQDKVNVDTILKDFKDRITEERMKIYEARVKALPPANQADKQLLSQINNEATRDATLSLSPYFQQRLDSWTNSGRQDIVNAIKEFENFGSEFRRRVNEEGRAIQSYIDPLSTRPGTPLRPDEFVGFKYYSPNIQKVGTFDSDIDEINFNFKQYKNQKPSALTDIEKAWDVYAIKNAKQLLTPDEKQIYEDFVKYKGNSGVINDIARRYDDLLNFTKKNMLYGSLSWHATNFADNMMKGYMELGFTNVIKDNGLKNLLNGTTKDFFNLARGKNITTTNQDLIEAAELGIIDSNMFRYFDDSRASDFVAGKPLDPRMGGTVVDPATGTVSQNTAGISTAQTPRKRLTDEEIRDFVTGPKKPDFIEQLGSAFKNAADRGIGRAKNSALLQSQPVQSILASAPVKMAQAATDKSLDSAYKAMQKGASIYNELLDVSQGLGSAIENTSKLSFYTRARDYLKDSAAYKKLLNSSSMDEADKWAKEEAAEWTRKTFFDYTEKPYADILVSRAMPFFRFYRKNLDYWTDVLMDPVKLSRLANADSIRQNIGQPIEDKDQFFASQRVLDNAPRSLGRDEQGNMRYMISPKLSYVDAINLMDFGRGGGEAGSRAAPIIRGGLDLLQGFDSFTKRPLYPSDLPGGIKDLYGRGFQYGLLPGFTFDRDGNPVATSDLAVALDKVRQSVAPTPILDQLSSAAAKVATDRMGPFEAASNALAPYQQVIISPLQAARTAKTYRNKQRNEFKAQYRLGDEQQ
jgi:hypothetical protein